MADPKIARGLMVGIDFSRQHQVIHVRTSPPVAAGGDGRVRSILVSANRPEKPRRSILLRVLGVLLLMAIVLGGLAFYLLRSDPSWYRRVELTEEQQAAGQQRLLDRLATLRNDVGRTQASVPATTQPAWPPFEVELTEDEVNGVLMRWSQAEPRLREALKSVQEPHVRFLSDRVQFAGRTQGSLGSIELSVEQTDEGPLVELGRPWAGRLPLSRELVERPGEQAVAQLRDEKAVPREVVDALEKLVAGDAVAPIIPLPSSLQGGGLLPARVEKLTIKDGVLKATLRPMTAGETSTAAR